MELRLTDGTFAAHADGTSVTVSAGAPAPADLVITTDDVTLDGDASLLPLFVDLFAFPALDPAAS